MEVAEGADGDLGVETPPKLLLGAEQLSLLVHHLALLAKGLVNILIVLFEFEVS